MSKFKTRAATVEADQWDPIDRPMRTLVRKGCTLPLGHIAFSIASGVGLLDSMRWGWLDANEGGYLVQPDDWIVNMGKGYIRLTPGEFESLYEPAPPDPRAPFLEDKMAVLQPGSRRPLSSEDLDRLAETIRRA